MEEPAVKIHGCVFSQSLAEELASVIMDAALREARELLREVEGNPRLENDMLEGSPDLRAPPSLAAAGSLDYPDAPPTTPLVPPPERSRQSFVRKLKGGLAREFLPSPPPSTPRETDDVGRPGAAQQEELIEHLLRSLTESDVGSKMEAFAESLSSDIVDRALGGKDLGGLAGDGDIHLLAERLADAILASSVDEARMLV